MNKVEIIGLVDSGATKSIIRSFCAERVGLNVGKSNSRSRWMLADNTGELKVVGCVVATIKIGETRIEHELVVVDKLAYDFIVGVGLLKALDSSLDFKENRWLVGNSEVPLSCAGGSTMTACLSESVVIPPMVS